MLYNSENEGDRQNAQQQLLSLQSSANYIPQCQYILDNSQSSYALFVASSALTRLITQYWNNFSVPQRVEIRNYILGYLASGGPQLPDFVAMSLIQLVSAATSQPLNVATKPDEK
jgi:exportin-7